MKGRVMKTKLTASIFVVTLIQGCASMAVSNDTLEANTAHALGLSVNQFTISDRQDRGIKTTYKVATKGGKSFSCYVTGGVSVVGAVVSDALCTEMASSEAIGEKKTGVSCNALLNAAGKC